MTQHVYFLGIGGTLMGSLAQLAQQMGLHVSGSDKALYPPMSDQLAAAGITVYEGFDPAQLDPAPDLVVIGNAALPRGNEAVEFVLESGIPYTSGAQWLGDAVLQRRWVLAVAGTHGKTTTASMLAWILQQAGLEPGYLIGGAPLNFPQSARLGSGPFFVVEADEYDTSYFDRRSKFVHYRPRTLIVNNLEFDHADIFDDLRAIQIQFHNLIRTVPRSGLILTPSNNDALNEVLAMGCWSQLARVGREAPKKTVAADSGDLWQPGDASDDGRSFDVLHNGAIQGRVSWDQMGQHNLLNALNAIAAARHAGVAVEHAIDALHSFQGVKRRMEVLYDSPNFTLYDDFAHHPTAIRSTLEGLRKRIGSNDHVLAIVEPRTHTMSLGTLRQELITCCAAADEVYWFRGENIKWDLSEIVQACVVPARMFDQHDKLIAAILQHATAHPNKKCHAVIMSNGAFGGIYQRLVEDLAS